MMQSPLAPMLIYLSFIALLKCIALLPLSLHGSNGYHSHVLRPPKYEVQEAAPPKKLSPSGNIQNIFLLLHSQILLSALTRDNSKPIFRPSPSHGFRSSLSFGTSLSL